MNIRDAIKSKFDEKGINYFQGSNKNENIFNVPYRGIQNRNNHINIYLDVDEELKIIKFTFIEKMNSVNEEIDIKSKLLDLNSSLNFGSLSMRSDSDTIEYKVDYQLYDDDFSFDQYNKFIVYCVTVYEKLKEEGII